MSLRATSIGHLQVHQAVAPVVIGSPRCTFVGRHSMRVTGRFVVAARVRALSGAQPFVAALSHQAIVRASFRHAPRLAQPIAISPIAHQVFAGAHPRSVSFAASLFAHQNTTEKTAPSSSTSSNPALNLAPFSRWTLRDKAAQRRLALLQGLPQIRKCA